MHLSFISFLILSQFIFFGCRTLTPTFSQGAREYSAVLPKAEINTILEKIKKRRGNLNTLSSFADIIIKRTKGTKGIQAFTLPFGTIRIKEAILLKRDSYIRMEILNIIGQPTTYIVTTEKDIKLYDVSEDVLFIGPPDISSIYKIIGIPLLPSDLVDILSGNLPNMGLNTSFRQVEGYRHFLNNDVFIKIYFDNIVQEVDISDDIITKIKIIEDNVLTIDIHYDKFDTIDNYMIPLNINILIPTVGQKLTFSFKKVMINLPIDNNMFDIKVSRDTKLKTLYDIGT